MKRWCPKCAAYYDDEFRTTICPHQTFAANDGKNNFAHHPESMYIPADHNGPPGIASKSRGVAYVVLSVGFFALAVFALYVRKGWL